MKIKKLTLPMFVLLFAMSCASPETHIQETKAVTPPTNVSSKEVASVEPISAEERTQEWFIAFDHFQSLGYDMQDADSLALIEIVKKYGDDKEGLNAIASTHEEEED